MRKFAGKAASAGLAALSSPLLAVATLAGLFLLTLLGTFHMQDAGLHAAVEKYFSSFLVWQDMPWSMPELPLPGAQALLVLLAVNLVIGGLIRMRWRWRNAGVIVTHLGILVLLVSGLITSWLGDSGMLMVWEGEASSFYADNHETELVIARAEPSGGVREWRVPERDFAAIGSSGDATFSHPEIPFRVRLEGWQEHCFPMAVAAGGAVADAVDGYRLQAAPRPKEGMLFKGCRAVLSGAGLAAERRELLWAAAEGLAPVSTSSGTWGIALRQRRYHLPYAVRLEDFRYGHHGRSRKPSFFESQVTVLDGTGQEERWALIEMNEPLRHGGYVLFQSNWGPQEDADASRHYTVLEIARNPTDHGPLVACIIIAIGLLWHFLMVLGRHLRRLARTVAVPVTLLALTAMVPAATMEAATPAGEIAAAVPEPAAAAVEPELRGAPWPAEALAAFARLPVQDSDGARIEPLHTWASYRLLRFHGKRSLSVQIGSGADARQERLDPIAWLLDLVYFPDQAERYPLFLIEDSSVLDAIGFDHAGRKKRDRYSLHELRPALKKLAEEGARIREIPARQRSAVQEQILRLASNVVDCAVLQRGLAFIGFRLATAEHPELAQLFPDRVAVDVVRILQQRDAVLERIRTLDASVGTAAVDQAFAGIFQAVDQELSRPVLALVPPPQDDPGQDRWRTLDDLYQMVWVERQPTQQFADQFAILQGLVDLHELRQKPDDFRKAAEEVTRRSAGLAEARDQYRWVRAEVFYNRVDWFGKAVYCLGLAVLMTVVLWMVPGSGWIYVLSLLPQFLGLGLAVTGIVSRCLIKSRAPITTLYETILFIGASGMLVLLLLELWTRRRLLGSLCAFFGLGLMIMAVAYEWSEARDTMEPMIAVLDSNFWLSTHVTAINLGYMGGLLAGALGHVLVFAPSLLRGKPSPLMREMSGILYGIIAFGLFFSVVGTILGGVWANFSWGRFWGWDPKENGALLICLWQIGMLHLRLTGKLREWGFALAAQLGNIVIAFSWWHVNLLEIGLHSYGFTSGVDLLVYSFYVMELAVALVALIACPIMRSGGSAVQIPAPVASSQGSD